MFRRVEIAVSVLLTAALAGCGTEAKPLAGSQAASGGSVGHARVDDARTSHLTCLRHNHLRAVAIGLTDIQVGVPPAGPKITFAPTPGAAQEFQIGGGVQGAEVIGSALLYPNQASDRELKMIEDCLAEGVSG